MTRPPTPADERLTELEIKLSFAEEQIDALNETVYRQQRQLEWLLAEVSTLRQQLPESKPGATGSLRDELPPHY